MVKQISDNDIYLLIKYIKSVLWRVAKCLSYIQDTWYLKVNNCQGDETDHSPPSGIEVKNTCMHGALLELLMCFHDVHSYNFFIFTFD